MLNPFWVWNTFPLIVAYWLLRRARLKGLRALPEGLFIGFTLGPLVLAHAAWIFDWNRTATGSSTSALMFIFLPIYALILGGMAYGIARLFTRREGV